MTTSTPAPVATRRSSRSCTVAAEPDELFDLVADPTQAVRIFPSVVHQEVLAEHPGGDRLRRWAWDGRSDVLRAITSDRELDRAARRIGTVREGDGPRGAWTFVPDGPGRTTVTLEHELGAGSAAAADAAVAELDERAETQLAQLRRFAERRDQLSEIEVSYEVEHVIDEPVDEVFDYFFDVRRWPERIPHCLDARVETTDPELQVVVMDVQVPSGALHTTKQGRVCFPGDKIVWRQLEGLPPLDEMLYGYMVFEPTDAGVRVRTGQTELLKPHGVAKRGWSMAEAKEHVAEVRGGRNLDALRSAAEYLGRRR